MPTRSKVKRLLPEPLRRELEEKIKQNAFSDYEALSDWLIEKGYQISKSALQRHGRELEDQIREMQAAVEEAKAIVESFPDDEQNIELATTKLATHKLYKVVQNLEESGEGVTVSQAARAIARSQPIVNFPPKIQTEIQQKVKETAKEVEKTAKTNGLSDDAINQIKQRILGITEE